MTRQTSNPGEAIRTLRTYAGLTLSEVAEGVDTAVSYLSKVETGKLIPAESYVARVTRFIAERLVEAA